MRKKLVISFALASALVTGLNSGCLAQERKSQEVWQARNEKYNLQDREKQLQQMDDALGRRIDDIKNNLNDLKDQLDTSLEEQDKIRHELIVIKLKLLN